MRNHFGTGRMMPDARLLNDPGFTWTLIGSGLQKDLKKNVSQKIDSSTLLW